MLTLRSALIACLLPLAPLLSAAAPGAANAEDVIDFASADEEMNSAIAAAQKSLPGFLELAGKADLSSGDYLVKWAHPVETGNNDREHIWVQLDTVGFGALQGRLANQPVDFSGNAGDPVGVPIAEISDWMYYRADGLIEGSYTTRVMLTRMSESDRQALEAQLAPLPDGQ